MKANSTESPFLTVLEPDETLLWQGRIGFTFVSSPFTVFALFLLAGYAFWAIWGLYSLNEFCPPSDSVRSCLKFYIVIPPAILLAAAAQCFDMLERRAIGSGQEKGAVLLTERRLIRVSDWPWRRIRAYDYRAKRLRQGISGVLRFGMFGSVALWPDDARLVLEVMSNTGTARP